MKKKILLLLAVSLFAKAYAQNSPSTGITPTDNFTYNGYTVSHYGLGWYNDPYYPPPTAYFSAFGGFKFFTQGQPQAMLDYNGKLSLGTITPLFKFHVAQDLSMAEDIDVAQMAITGASDPAKRMVFGYDVNGAGFGFIKAGWYGHQWTNLVLQPGGGHVGVGTGGHAPEGVLEVGAPLNSGETATMQKWDWNQDAGSWGLKMNMYHSGTSIDYQFIQRAANTDYNVLTFKNGNTGIGTATPRQPLEVNGAIVSTGVGTVNFPSNGLFDYSIPDQSTRIISRGADNSTPGNFKLSGQSADASVTNLIMTALGDGRVGINTASPAFALQVQKTSVQNPAIMIGGGYSGGPRLQVYGLDADAQAYMGLGTDMAGGPYEHSVYFPNVPSSKLTFGTYNGSQYSAKMTLSQTGALGIGAAAPSELLSLGEETPGNGRRAIRVGAGSYSEPAGINTNSQGDKIILYDAAASAYDGRIGIGDRANFWMKSMSTMPIYGSFEWFGGNDNSTPKMVLSGSGDLSIGVFNSHGYKLAVNGTAHAKEVKVDMNDWNDKVFDKNYALPSLTDVAAFIARNKHLSEIPAEKDVLENGIALGDMNKILVKKVEELTLYLIDKDKEIKDLKQSQQIQIDELKSQVALLIKKAGQ